jgi:hypothetical protein
MPVEYRVWVHPAKGGDDYFYAFETPHEALRFYNKVRFSAKYRQVERPLTATSTGKRWKERHTTSAEYAWFESSGRNEGSPFKATMDEILGFGS